MILTFRLSSGFDRPIYIQYLSTFINSVFDEVYVPDFLRLYDDEGHLIGRSATYEAV